MIKDPHIERIKELNARIADLQRTLDEANEQLAEWQVIGSWKETALKAMAALDAERERYNELDRMWGKTSGELATAWTDLATERQARQQAEGTAEDYRLEREAYRKSYEEASARAQQAEGERDDAISIVRRNGGWDTAFDDLLARKAAEARLADAVGLLREIFLAYCGQMGDEYDFPDNPWTPERGHRSDGSVPDESALRTRAFLARVDASSEEPAT